MGPKLLQQPGNNMLNLVATHVLKLVTWNLADLIHKLAINNKLDKLNAEHWSYLYSNNKSQLTIDYRK